MSPEQFRRVRRKMGLSQNDVTDLFGLGSSRTVRRWEDGERDIPGPVILLMELCQNIPAVRQYLEVGEYLNGESRADEED